MLPACITGQYHAEGAMAVAAHIHMRTRTSSVVSVSSSTQQCVLSTSTSIHRWLVAPDACVGYIMGMHIWCSLACTRPVQHAPKRSHRLGLTVVQHGLMRRCCMDCAAVCRAAPAGRGTGGTGGRKMLHILTQMRSLFILLLYSFSIVDGLTTCSGQGATCANLGTPLGNLVGAGCKHGATCAARASCF